MNDCFSAVLMTQHIHNFPNEDLGESVCPTGMLFYIGREGIAAVKDTCFDQYCTVGCNWSNGQFGAQRIIEMAGIQNHIGITFQENTVRLWIYSWKPPCSLNFIAYWYGHQKDLSTPVGFKLV